MSLRRNAVAALWAGGACLAFAPSEEPVEGPPPAHELAWLAGSWKGTIEGGEWEASYTSAEGGEVLSASKELRGGRVAMIEFEHFRVVDGVLVMTPFPFGKRSDTSFAITELDRDARRAVFANPDHDFSQEIVYHRAAEDRLAITVAGRRNDEPVKLRRGLQKNGPRRLTRNRQVCIL